jgi:hypothetical protein
VAAARELHEFDAPRPAPRHLRGGIAQQQVGFRAADDQDRQRDRVPDRPEVDVGRRRRPEGLADRRVVVQPP